MRSFSIMGFRPALIGVLMAGAAYSPTFAADFSPIDISSQANFNLQSHNALFPTGGFLTRYAVPFFIPDAQTNAWGSGNGIEGGCFCNDGLWQVDVPINMSGLKTIYTLAGANWGRGGSNMTITGLFDNGRQAVWTFTDGQQLRDWNLYPAFTTTINGTNANEVFRVSPPLPAWDNNPDVLDMQTLAIPLALQGAVLQKLVIADERRSIGGFHSGFIAGITVSSIGAVTPALEAAVVPEPGATALALSGLALLWVGKVRKTRRGGGNRPQITPTRWWQAAC